MVPDSASWDPAPYIAVPTPASNPLFTPEEPRTLVLALIGVGHRWHLRRPAALDAHGKRRGEGVATAEVDKARCLRTGRFQMAKSCDRAGTARLYCVREAKRRACSAMSTPTSSLHAAEQPAIDWAGLTVADGLAIAFDDRQHADRRAGKHRFVGGAQLFDGQRPHDERNAPTSRRVPGRRPGSRQTECARAAATRVPRRSRYTINVGGRGFGDVAILIQHNGPRAGPLCRRFAIGQIVVHPTAALELGAASNSSAPGGCC